MLYLKQINVLQHHRLTLPTHSTLPPTSSAFWRLYSGTAPTAEVQTVVVVMSWVYVFVCVCVGGSLPHLPGCAFQLLMLYNLVKIAWGILAYSWSSKPPSCFRGKPCGKHALNLTRCRMYNVAYSRSYRPLNIITLIQCTFKHAEWVILHFKPMRLIRMIIEDVG